MKKEIREVNKEKGIVRITCPDERWYVKALNDPITGLPMYKYVPSVTWITSFYYKSPELVKWIANQGLDEAERIKRAAGDKGSKIHLAIEDLLAGKEIKIDAKYQNKTTGEMEELTPEEYGAVVSFKDWYKEVKPEVLGFEYVVWNDEYGYAGTVDLKCKIGGEVWLIDLKSGQNVYTEYELQVSAYAMCHSEKDVQKLGILQVGYKRNKDSYKFTEVSRSEDLFLAVKKLWANETAKVSVPQKDYPLSVSLVEKKELPELPKQKNAGESKIDIGNKRSRIKK